MPEGDVVWRTARQLNEALSGRVLTRSDFRVPRHATANLVGRTVLVTEPRGKHMLTRVEGELTIHSHLRMDGSWRIWPAGGYPPRDHRVRLVLENDAWRAVGYLLGVVELMPTGQERRAVGHLGPDLLGPDWDSAEAVRRLRLQPGRAAAEALLDQSNLAGIGNLYKAEVLFMRGVNPWSPIGEIADLGALVDLAQHLLDINKERVTQITTGSSVRGQETWVYGRGGRPCRRCGSGIRSAEGPGAGPAGNASAAGGRPLPGRLASGTDLREGRLTYWCPRCQPGP